MASLNPRWKLPLGLFLLAGMCLCFSPRAFAQETGSPSTLNLTEKLLRKAEVERKVADKSRWRVFEQGNPIPRTKAEILEPPPKPLPPPPTPEEMQSLAEEAQRLASKTWVTDVIFATVFENAYTEVEFYRGGKRLKALINADLSTFRSAGIFETADKVFHPFIIITRWPGNAGETSVSENVLASASNHWLEDFAPGLRLLAPPGGRLEYVVGYDSTAAVGQEGDYETLDALLDHHQPLGGSVPGESAGTFATTRRGPGSLQFSPPWAC